MKYSLKETSSLLDLHSTKSTEFMDLLSNLSGAGSKAATKIIYARLVAMSCDSSNGKERWLLKPDSFTKTSDIEKWMRSKNTADMNSEDLLNIFKASTYKMSLKFLFDSGLIHVDKFNKLTMRYPFGGKLLSLQYAVKAIKSSYKKKPIETSLDTDTNSKVESLNVVSDETPFWEKD